MAGNESVNGCTIACNDKSGRRQQATAQQSTKDRRSKVSALPLRCLVVHSVPKSQGIIVRKDNTFEMLIVNLPTEQKRTTPGLELVELSRPDSIHNLAIGNDVSGLSHIMIMKIGTAPSYAKRRFFLNHMHQMAPQTQPQTRDLIAHLCPLSPNAGGGLKLLN